MKHTLFVYIILLSLAVSAQKKPPFIVFKSDTINRTDAKGLKQGVWKKYYPNDSLFSIGQFKNGKPYGVFKTFYKTGEQQATLTYRKGSEVADMIIYHE